MHYESLYQSRDDPRHIAHRSLSNNPPTYSSLVVKDPQEEKTDEIITTNTEQVRQDIVQSITRSQIPIRAMVVGRWQYGAMMVPTRKHTLQTKPNRITVHAPLHSPQNSTLKAKTFLPPHHDRLDSTHECRAKIGIFLEISWSREEGRRMMWACRRLLYGFQMAGQGKGSWIIDD